MRTVDAVPFRVEHGVGQREGLRHVVPGPGERRGVGVFEELFPEVFRTVDDELVVLEDAVVDFDREEDVALGRRSRLRPKPCATARP